jgi:hypothetical protein
VRGVELHVKPLGRAGGLGISPGSCLISAGVVVLTLGLAPGLQAGRTGASSETTQPKNYDRLASAEWQIPDSRGLRLASWETEAVFESATERENWQAEFATSSIDRDTSPKYLETDSAAASFDERFTGAVDSRVGSQNTAPHRPPSSDRDARVGAQRAVGQSGRGSAPFPTLPPAATMKPVRVADASAQEDSSLLSDAAARIAIYDIAAHGVYLPSGRRLEAHSGLGKYRDDPRHVSEKDRGPTPPNVYDLSLREHLFHGVRAIRLIPAGMGNMFGRDGMLAHTYMRGRSGQSNGCVSFSDYHAFLNVVRSGEINRLVVVEHLATTLNHQSAPEWPPETIKALLVSIQSAPSGAAIVVNPGIQVTEDAAPVEATPLEPDASVVARP